MNEKIETTTSEVSAFDTASLELTGNVYPAQFQVNFHELEKILDEKLEEYKDRAVTADSLSADKQDSKNLASLRIRIDKFRKQAKAKAEKPIKEFEESCKALVAKVDAVKRPLDEQIELFNDQIRLDKEKFARDTAVELVSVFGLNDKYAGQIIIRDSYLNLSQTQKFVRDDLTAQVQKLKMRQDSENNLIASAQSLIDALNVNIIQKMCLNDFEKEIEESLDPESAVPNGYLLQQINNRAIKIADAEKEAARRAEEKAKADAEAAARHAIEEAEAKAKAETEKVKLQAEAEMRKMQEQAIVDAQMAQAAATMKAKLEAKEEARIAIEKEKARLEKQKTAKIQPMVTNYTTEASFTVYGNELMGQFLQELSALVTRYGFRITQNEQNAA